MFGSILAGSLGGKSQGGGTVNTGVLQLSGGGALTGTLKAIEDQAGNISPLQLSNINVEINSPAGAGNERRLIINTADSLSAKIFSFRTANLQRFAFRVDGTESTGNAGSNFHIRRYDDAGNFILSAFTINRATGAISVTPSNLTYSTGTNNINLIDLAYTINTTGGTNVVTGLNINATHTSITGTTSRPFNISRGGLQKFSVDLDNTNAYVGINQNPSSAYSLYVGNNVLFSNNLFITNFARIVTSTGLDWSSLNTDFTLTSGSGIITLTGARIRLSGTTSAFPALKRNGTTIEIRTADDSAYGNIDAGRYFSNGIQGQSGTFLTADAKTVTVTNGIITSIV
jgi:hypothetical protein